MWRERNLLFIILVASPEPEKAHLETEGFGLVVSGTGGKTEHSHPSLLLLVILYFFKTRHQPCTRNPSQEN